MSGSIKVVDNDTPLEKHDHFELVFTNDNASNGSTPKLSNKGCDPFSENNTAPKRLGSFKRSLFPLVNTS
jgi:formamidopyrimidine-DNA glycosylase